MSRIAWFTLLVAAIPGPTPAEAATAGPQNVSFEAIPANLPGVTWGSAAWGDYDADGDLDFVLCGYGTDGQLLCRIYRNDGNNSFADIAAELPGVIESSLAWGDYDNDEDLDLLLTGDTHAGYVSRLYRYDGNDIFTDLNVGFPGVRRSAVAWGDADNDGRLDILLTGDTGSEHISRIYHNGGDGSFTSINAGLPGIHDGSAAWGDYDNDGDLDILLLGTPAGPSITRLYRNDGGGFVNTNILFMGLHWSSAAWGDYDDDGDLDILLAGENDDPGPYTILYRNNGGDDFDLIFPGTESVMLCSVVWGDFDNDGYQDILLTGNRDPGQMAIVYRNNGDATWTDYHAGLVPVDHGSALWGDYDDDGDLDILLTGGSGSERISRIYRSNGGQTNTPPAAPVSLTAQRNGEWVTFAWDASSDDQTPAAGLSYNLRIGTTPGGGDILSAMADGTQGRRRIVQLGNTNLCRSWRIRIAPELPFYWSVQAIDGAFAGSPFAPEQSVSGVGEEPEDGRAMLLSASPNPFTQTISIRYARARGETSPLAIFDPAGLCVRVLEDGRPRAGPTTVVWDGRDESGRQAPSGMYYVRLARSGRICSVPIVLLR